MKKSHLAVAVAGALCVSVLTTAPPASAADTRSKTLSCGTNYTLSISGNVDSWQNHWWRGSIVNYKGVGGWLYTNRTVHSGGVAMIEGGSINRWSATCFCPSGVSCGV